MGDRSYLLLHAGFFTCGFHIAFLVTHLPGEVDLCGLPASVASWTLAIIGLTNIAGSLYAGHAVSLYRGKMVLFWMYASRALLVIAYLLAPKTDWTFYLFAAGLGFTWLATVPPTATIVGKLFGVRYLGTLFGLTLLSHQIGGFLGAWLGGIISPASATTAGCGTPTSCSPPSPPSPTCRSAKRGSSSRKRHETRAAPHRPARADCFTRPGSTCRSSSSNSRRAPAPRLRRPSAAASPRSPSLSSSGQGKRPGRGRRSQRRQPRLREEGCCPRRREARPRGCRFRA